MSRDHGWLRALLVGVALLTGAAPASGQGADPDRLRVGLGYVDVANRHAPALSIEGTYRWGKPLVPWTRPHVGGMMTSEGSIYGYAGFRIPFELGSGLGVAPSFSGGFFHPGTDLDLGSAVEFRSGIELYRRSGSGHGFSIYFYHLSNGGHGRRNPGVEVLGTGLLLPTP